MFNNSSALWFCCSDLPALYTLISHTDLKSCTVCTRSSRSLHLSMMAFSGANTGEFLAGHEHRPIPPPPPFTATEEPPNILIDEPATGWLWWCWGRCNWLPCTELMVNVSWELYGKLVPYKLCAYVHEYLNKNFTVKWEHFGVKYQWIGCMVWYITCILHRRDFNSVKPQINKFFCHTVVRLHSFTIL